MPASVRLPSGAGLAPPSPPPGLAAGGIAAVGLGAVLGWVVAIEQPFLFDRGLWPAPAGGSPRFFWPLTVALLVAGGLVTAAIVFSRELYRHRVGIILLLVTVAPFFSGLNAGPLDASDPAFLGAFTALLLLLAVEGRDVRLEPVVLTCLAAIIAAAFTSVVAGRVSTIVQLHTVITKVLLVFIMCNVLRTGADVTRFVRVFLFCAVITAVLAIGSQFLFLTTGIPLTFDDAEGFHYKNTPFGRMLRATAFMTSTQGLAHVMLIGAALTLAAPMRWWMRVVCFGLLAGGAFSTFSAGSYLAMGMVVVIAPFVMLGRLWLPLLVGYGAFGMGLFLSGYWRMLLDDVLIPLGLRNFLERMEFIRRGLRGAENWPWTGNGVGNIGRHLETAIHNAYIQGVVDIGVIGGAAFAILLFYLIVANWTLRHSGADRAAGQWSRAFVLTLSGMAIHLFFEPFFNNTVTWLLIGAAAANITATPGRNSIDRGHIVQDFETELDRSMSGYLTTLYRSRFIILLAMLSAGYFGYHLSKSIEPRYEATAQFYLPESATRPGRDEAELPVAPVPSGNRDGATAAVSLLRTDALRARVNELVPEKPFAELDLDVDPVVERSSMVHVYVRDTEPDVAARVANAYFQAFTDFVADQQESQQDGTLERTTARLKELDGEIAQVASTDRDRMERLLGLRDTLAESQRSLERRALQDSPPAIMASAATPPAAPVFPIVALNVVVAAIAGLILGTLYAVLLDHVRSRMRQRRAARFGREAAIAEFMGELPDLTMRRELGP